MTTDETNVRVLNRDRATFWWGIGAVVLALFTSVFAAGFFLATRSSVTTTAVRVSQSTVAPESIPTAIPTTVKQPATPRSSPVSAPDPILPYRSTTRFGWTVWVLFAALVLFVSLPLLARKTPSAQKVRVWTAAIFGVGVVVTVQSIGLLLIPTFAALVMAARTGRHGQVGTVNSGDLRPNTRGGETWTVLLLTLCNFC
jgi:hypothetical protein